MGVEEYFRDIRDSIKTLREDISDLKETTSSMTTDVSWIKGTLGNGKGTFKDHEKRIRHLEWRVVAIIVALGASGYGTLRILFF